MYIMDDTECYLLVHITAFEVSSLCMESERLSQIKSILDLIR